MKKSKILWLLVTVGVFLGLTSFSTVSVAESKQLKDTTAWREQTVVSPAQEALVPAGSIWLKWQAIEGAVQYKVYLDDQAGETVAASSASTLEHQVYTVVVDTHVAWIEAELANGQKIVSKPRTFYVSKKGLGYFDDLANMQEMNLSWYYNWNTSKSTAPVVGNLDFTPMFWNGALDASKVEGYKTVLGSNEPDHSGQANTPAATVAENWWPSFINSGKRIGSPAAAWEYENKPGQWLYDFMSIIQQPNGNYPVDFIAIHDYPGWPGDTGGGDQIAGFKAKIEDLWNRYHKPIWITEFAVANWPSNQDDIQSWGYSKQNVYDYLNKLQDYLDQSPYVERYAWFSFGDPDGNPYGESAGSYSALTNRKTGNLTALGELYRDKGNPQHRTIAADALPPALAGSQRANVALGKTAVTNAPGNGAVQNGLDGDQNTRFESVHGGNYELTYTIDLGRTYTVDEVAIDWEAPTTAANKFKIELATSTTGPWTKVYEKTAGDPVQNMSATFNASQARYVKLTASEKTGPWGYSFWEFSVFGK